MPDPNDPLDCADAGADDASPISDSAWADAKRMLRNRRTKAPGLPLSVILMTYREQLCNAGRRVAVLDGATTAHIAILDGDHLDQGGATLVVRDVSNEFDIRVERVFLEAEGREHTGCPWDGHPMHLALPAWRHSTSRWILRFCKQL